MTRRYNGPQRIRIVLLDDHDAVRIGLSATLTSLPGIEVVGEAASAAEALHLARYLCPDVAILDVRLPEVPGASWSRSGVATARALRTHDSNVRVLLLTSYTERQAILDTVLAGAVGYLVKTINIDDTSDLIRHAAETKHNRPQQAHIDQVRRTVATSTAAAGALDAGGGTRDVLDLVIDGRTDREIAQQLEIPLVEANERVRDALIAAGASIRGRGSAGG